MKKSTLLAMLLLAATLLIGCRNEPYHPNDSDDQSDTEQTASNQTENDSEKDDSNGTPAEETNEDKIKKFAQFIIDSEYADAIEYYNSSLLGNFELEVMAQDKIIAICNDINNKVLSGEYDQKTVQNELGVIDKIVEGTNATPDGYDQVLDSIDYSLESKAAYSAATDLESLKNYSDAIKQYKLVIEGDSNYTAAQEAVERCTETLKNDALTQAEELVSENDYISAINVLNEAFKTLPDESDLQAKITVYEKSYISYVVSQANAAFVTPASDYEAALNIINAGLQYYPENGDLSEKKAYYLSYAPVNICDLESIRGEAYTVQSDTDTYGNTYTKCFICHWSNEWADITYNLNGSYNLFTATIYGRSNENDSEYAYIKVYGDDVLIYENNQISDNTTKPFDISLNVTGVSELRILMDNDLGRANIGMTNTYIQKTVK